MNKHSDDLKRVATRMMTEKGQYYEDSKMYLNSIMKAMRQEDLISALSELNIHELKQVMAAGVPGHAEYIAKDILRKMKDDIQAYIEKKGSRATATIEVEADTADEKKDEDEDSSTLS